VAGSTGAWLHEIFLLMSAMASAASCMPVVLHVRCQATGVMTLPEAV